MLPVLPARLAGGVSCDIAHPSSAVFIWRRDPILGKPMVAVRMVEEVEEDIRARMMGIYLTCCFSSEVTARVRDLVKMPAAPEAASDLTRNRI